MKQLEIDLVKRVPKDASLEDWIFAANIIRICAIHLDNGKLDNASLFLRKCAQFEKQLTALLDLSSNEIRDILIKNLETQHRFKGIDLDKLTESLTLVNQ